MEICADFYFIFFFRAQISSKPLNDVILALPITYKRTDAKKESRVTRRTLLTDFSFSSHSFVTYQSDPVTRKIFTIGIQVAKAKNKERLKCWKEARKSLIHTRVYASS